jgi:hypothetical protein
LYSLTKQQSGGWRSRRFLLNNAIALLPGVMRKVAMPSSYSVLKGVSLVLFEGTIYKKVSDRFLLTKDAITSMIITCRQKIYHLPEDGR